MRAAVALLVICSGGGTSVDVSTLDELQDAVALRPLRGDANHAGQVSPSVLANTNLK